MRFWFLEGTYPLEESQLALHPPGPKAASSDNPSALRMMFWVFGAPEHVSLALLFKSESLGEKNIFPHKFTLWGIYIFIEPIFIHRPQKLLVAALDAWSP